MASKCIIPTVFSACYFFIYAVALITLLCKKRIPFTSQIKIVLSVLFLALAVQATSSSLSQFAMSNDVGDSLCEQNELS